uniref:NB-ARC domains-containing protein n=1 Tax=Tanacetum cinerariifolium TaxID=118510 RepID=A0A699SW74_TANCI|nr:NB-ARC domains-containing protein [Tanacetum cinerariifolium]
MENLKEIWPPQFSIEIEQLSSSLRSIEVNKCDSLVKLFSCNPFPLFNNLQELKVKSCGSIQVLFGTDLGRARKIEEQLREVWRIKDAGNDLIHGFEAVESIRIYDCKRFENIITPATTNFEMRALKQVAITDCGGESERNDEMVESKQDQEVCTTLNNP